MPLDAARLASAGTLNTARGSRALRKDFASWAGAAFADIAQAPKPEGGWTPNAVGDQYLAALKWVRYSAGRVGPAGFGGMRLPETILTDEEHATMGWGLKESADNTDDLPTMRVQPSTAQITRHLDALEWPMHYLCPANVGSARNRPVGKLQGVQAALLQGHRRARHIPPRRLSASRPGAVDHLAAFGRRSPSHRNRMTRGLRAQLSFRLPLLPRKGLRPRREPCRCGTRGILTRVGKSACAALPSSATTPASTWQTGGRHIARAMADM